MTRLAAPLTSRATPGVAAASRSHAVGAGTEGARRAKGQQTRAVIVEAALTLAARDGLEGLSIGAVAEATGMSKSGVFAHFGSREELQISVIRAYHQRFEDEVVRPALTRPRGLPRLRALFRGWLTRVTAEVESGCIYISGAVEFDDRPGVVRDALSAMVRTWQDALRRAVTQAQEAGHLRREPGADQIVFEIQSIVLGLHHDARFLRSPGATDRALHAFNRLIAGARTSAAPADPAP